VGTVGLILLAGFFALALALMISRRVFGEKLDGPDLRV
jgi:hypothetical protein